ncbi:MAG: hypothetical protein M3Y08_01295 [Fibrobacterota bacterium]|nr:hypothetical protein [Fibrobacterota bacterium]
MEDTATIDTGTVLDTQSTETDSQAPEATTTQAEPAGSPSLKDLLKRQKEDPNVKFNDSELDVLDKHYDEPKTKTKAAKPEKEEAEEDEAPAPKPKVEPEKEEKPEPEEVEESEEDDSDPEAKAILKEVGAKSLKDAAAKIKDLKRLVGGKDAQAVARVTKEKDDLVRSGRELWSALAMNDPAAIAFAEKTFGVKFGGQAQKPAEAAQGDRYIDPAKFIDAESADIAEAAFQRQEAKIKALEAKFGTIEQERDRHIQDTVKKQSISSVVDEMALIAGKIPELKTIPGFREAAQAVLDGKSDSRLDVFTDLFDIAATEKCSLRAAYDIKRGRDSDRIEAQAIERGRKEAYSQKPNPSLSGVTGGRGEATYQPVTAADLEKWKSDHTTHPESWYDKEGDLLQNKVPRKAWSIFGFK